MSATAVSALSNPALPRPRAADGPDVDVAVIGAGPHGLSASVHLRRAGVSVHTFGEAMSFWRAMPKGMRLRSNLSATNMIEPAGPFSLASYMKEVGETFTHPVSLSRFIDYGTWVQRNGVPDADGRAVTRVERSTGGFTLELEDGESATARRVVVACGVKPFERIPPGFEGMDPRLVSHTGHHADLSQFAGRRVAVVGGGQSALEGAVLMQERGAEVEVIARAPQIVWLRSWSPIHFMGRLGKLFYSPTDVGPLWYSRLVATPVLFTRLPRETQNRIAYRSIRPACSYFVKVRADGIKVTVATEVTAAVARHDGLHLTLSDRTTRNVDHLMFATGYQVDVARYPFLGAAIVSDLHVVEGFPVLQRGLESSVPGLHFMGAPAAWSFGPTQRFVSGSWFGGSRVASGIVHSRRSSRRSGLPVARWR